MAIPFILFAFFLPIVLVSWFFEMVSVVNVDTAIDQFMNALWNHGYIIVACILLWFVLAEWVFNIKNRSKINYQYVWYILLICLIILMSLIGTFTLPNLSSSSGYPFMWLFYTLFYIAAYYFSTIFCTPNSFKYTPPKAIYFRKWRLLDL